MECSLADEAAVKRSHNLLSPDSPVVRVQRKVSAVQARLYRISARMESVVRPDRC